MNQNLVQHLKKLLPNLKLIQDILPKKLTKENLIKYIEFIDKSQITYNSNNLIKQFDYVKKLPISDFNELETKINYRNVYETELNNVLFDYDYINLNDFEKQKLINATPDYKIYNIINKKTKKMYFAKKFKEKYVENDLKEYFSKEVNI